LSRPTGGQRADIIIRILGRAAPARSSASRGGREQARRLRIIAIEEDGARRPDGYTLMIGNVSTNAITPILFKSKFSIDYDRDVVAARARRRSAELLRRHGGGFPAKTFAEFIAYARSAPARIRYCAPGNGSFPHLTLEMFAKKEGLDLVNIPVKAGPPATSTTS